jgi:hypothetical protein
MVENIEGALLQSLIMMSLDYLDITAVLNHYQNSGTSHGGKH